jgi:DNA adenine methylase
LRIDQRIRFIRYPGGKQRLLRYLAPYLPTKNEIKGYYVEPFLGGGAVFFAVSPKKAILSDINPVLIDLYRGLRRYPRDIWQLFQNFPKTKEGYYKIRDAEAKSGLAYRAARTLYLNRTCFKGMWRENSNGQFNVGYGGEDRRWVINEQSLLAVSVLLKKAKLFKSDFKEVIADCCREDFLFLDPPYSPGGKELIHHHYVYSKFSFDEHIRLANVLKKATKKKIRWAMTTSSHSAILNLYEGLKIIHIKNGTGKMPGLLSNKSGEVLICNY